MKMNLYDQKNLKEEVLTDVVPVNNAPEIDEKPPIEKPQRALDDAMRVKILSPGMLVFKRFVRSKLAIAGTLILIFMFSFAFLGGWIIPYKEDEVFKKFDYMEKDYGMASFRSEFVNISLNDDISVHYSVSAMMNSNINKMNEQGLDEMSLTDNTEDKNEYTLKKLGSRAYILENIQYFKIGTREFFGSDPQFVITDPQYNNEEFKTAVNNAIGSKLTTMYFQSTRFIIKRDGGVYNIRYQGPSAEALLASDLVFDSYEQNIIAPQAFKIIALKNLYTGSTFIYEDKEYTITQAKDSDSIFTISDTATNNKIYRLSRFVVRRYNGEDTLPIDFKFAVQGFIGSMTERGVTKDQFEYTVRDSSFYEEEEEEEEEETGEEEEDEETDENEPEEEPLDPVIHSFRIERKGDLFYIRGERLTYLIDIDGPPSKAHLLGTDSNGMDVLARMMYGGRVSLMIGFIVIFIEMFIGIIFGGIAGYFGKWLDNLIMRIVDVFNCIPFLPIMIILGSVFDKLQLESYDRIAWLMAIMGFLGWPGIARLVRGQILSLREQEFMIAAEATGISAKRRIFRHLVPNVMPQLIVNATMGLGSIIIMESTLSFLGLGAKYPMATWGSMINSVSDPAALVNFTYVWIPVGMLICLTVIAFNFVGDGLRDAFDPKMKR